MLVLVSFGDVSMSVDASKRVPEVARTHADTPTYNLLASDRGQLSLYTAFSVITTGRRILTVGALQGGGVPSERHRYLDHFTLYHNVYLFIVVV